MAVATAPLTATRVDSLVVVTTTTRVGSLVVVATTLGRVGSLPGVVEDLTHCSSHYH